MRLDLWIGGVAAAGLAVAAAACGGSDSTDVPADSDAGASSSSSSGASSSSSSSGSTSSSSSSGGSSSGEVTITPKELKAGGAVLLGVTDDELAVYVTIGGASSALEAVPLAGGAPTVIAATIDVQTDNVVVSGGAVGWWTGINQTTGVGTFNVWTKADGAKTALSAASASGIFTATADGTRIAFSTAATAAVSDIAVLTTATATAQANGIFAAADSINLTALEPPAQGQPAPCGLDMSFVGKKLLAAFCVPASDTDARLYLVPDGTTTEIRLDSAGAAAGAIRPFWIADATASKILVIGTPPNATGRIITPGANTGASTSVALENGTGLTGFLTDDGSAVVYRTAAGLRRAATGATPAPKMLVAGAKSLLDTTADKTRVLLRTLDPAQTGIDIRSADTTTENQTPKDIVATASASPLGFTGSGAHALYLSDVSQTGNKLKAQPAAGGMERELAKDIEGVAVAPEGDGVILLENGQAQGQLTLYDARYVNAATGASSKKIADGIPDSGFQLVKKKLVYSRIAQMGAGLFVADLP